MNVCLERPFFTNGGKLRRSPVPPGPQQGKSGTGWGEIYFHRHPSPEVWHVCTDVPHDTAADATITIRLRGHNMSDRFHETSRLWSLPQSCLPAFPALAGVIAAAGGAPVLRASEVEHQLRELLAAVKAEHTLEDAVACATDGLAGLLNLWGNEVPR